MKNSPHEKFLKKTRDLVGAIYRLTATFPEDDASVMTGELRDTVLNLECRIEEALRRNPTRRGHPTPIEVAQGKLMRLSSGLHLGKGIKYIDAKTYKDLIAKLEDIQGEIDRFIGPRAVAARERRWERLLKIDAEIAAEVEAGKKN